MAKTAKQPKAPVGGWPVEQKTEEQPKRYTLVGRGHSCMEGATIDSVEFGSRGLLPAKGSYGASTFVTDIGVFVIASMMGELSFYELKEAK